MEEQVSASKKSIGQSRIATSPIRRVSHQMRHPPDAEESSSAIEDEDIPPRLVTLSLPSRDSHHVDVVSADTDRGPRLLKPSHKSKAKQDSDNDVEDGERGTEREPLVQGGGAPSRRFASSSQALASGLAYCISSCAMILLNKLVLSGFGWKAQITLMLYQNLVSVVAVLVLSKLKLITTEPLTWRLVRIWIPVNVIFIGMLITSFWSLVHLQVAMVTILKNMTNLVTAVGEMYMFKKRHSFRVWSSLVLMVVSAFFGGITDLSFHPTGYTWQIFNCLFTASYSLYLRRVMDKAKQATRAGHLSEFTMVLLNNSLSLPLGLVLVLIFGEYRFVMQSPLLHNTTFWCVTTLSGFLGLAISFTSMWFLHQTSPTTYSLIGSLNKIPLSIAGIIIFKAPTTLPNLASILFGCFAGVLFAQAKMKG